MYVNDIGVENQYAYIACNDNFQVLDISNPASPILMGEIAFSIARSVFLTDNFAFVSTVSGSGLSKGMQIVDISDPADPVVLGSFASTGQWGTWQTYVLNDLAYLADSQGGLKIVDVSNPANPVEVGNYLTSGIAASVFVSGDYAYVGIVSDMGSIAGVEVIDVSDLSNLNIAGYYTVFDQGYDVFVTDNIVYVASGKDGLNILEFMEGVGIEPENEFIPISYMLKQNYPNPFHSTATISYQLKEHGEVILSIYNVRGQLVKKLVHSREIVGKHSIVWDGKDEGGKKLSSGIYFYQIETPNFKSQIKKMVLIR